MEQYEDLNDHEGEPYAWADEFVEDTWRRLWGPNIESLPSQLHHAPHRTLFFAFLYLFLSVGGVTGRARSRETVLRVPRDQRENLVTAWIPDSSHGHPAVAWWRLNRRPRLAALKVNTQFKTRRTT